MHIYDYRWAYYAEKGNFRAGIMIFEISWRELTSLSIRLIGLYIRPSVGHIVLEGALEYLYLVICGSNISTAVIYYDENGYFRS